MTQTPEQIEEAVRNVKLAALLEPFPPEAIGKLPKGGRMLDFVGHAAVTKRLLAVDPGWSWEPLALTPAGLPMFDPGMEKGLWIRLTICGVSRLGYGDGDSVKECIGDAIRNAAMRFGVALDLWAREDISSIGSARPEPEVDGEASQARGALSETEGDAPGLSPPSSESHEHVWIASPKLSKWEICSVPRCVETRRRPAETVLTAPVTEDEARKDLGL